uniref:Uncharacterized protein n=1 Tax=Picea sitchensis TaxID=3332 RepID=C0PSI5_PICSI|nr:unknown [Picea sitchensis]
MLKPELNWGLGSYLGMRTAGGVARLQLGFCGRSVLIKRSRSFMRPKP